MKCYTEMTGVLFQRLVFQVCCGCSPAGIDSPEDLCILHSNRAACYLKDGNSTECIQDCTKYETSVSSVRVCQWLCVIRRLISQIMLKSSVCVLFY